MNDEAAIQRGESAALSMVRVAPENEKDTALQQVLIEDEEILLGPLSATVTFGDLTSMGNFVITSERLLSWSSKEEEDLSIPAVCIDLHAQAEDSVYIQITNGEDLEEMTIRTTDESLETVFSKLSQLVSLHPIDPNETEDGMMMSGDDDDGMVWAPPAVPSTTGDGEATEEERQAMLDHLDRILIVPPELEQSEQEEGQFDDAEDDEDIL